MTSLLRRVAFLSLATGLASCRSDFGGAECEDGHEGCPCVGGSGGTCLGSLTCDSGVCVDEGGTSGDGDGDGDGDGPNLLQNGDMEDWNVALLQDWSTSNGVVTKDEDNPHLGSRAANFASTSYGSIEQNVGVSYLAGTCFEVGAAVRYNNGDMATPYVNNYTSFQGDVVDNFGLPLSWIADGAWHEAIQSFELTGEADAFSVTFSSGAPDPQSLSFDDVFLRVVECP